MARIDTKTTALAAVTAAFLGVLGGGRAAASDYEIPVRDGGADPSWPPGAVVRYELCVTHGDDYEACLAQRHNRDGGASARLRVTEKGITEITLQSLPPDGEFEKCLRAVLSKVSARTDGGSVSVNLVF